MESALHTTRLEILYSPYSLQELRSLAPVDAVVNVYLSNEFVAPLSLIRPRLITVMQSRVGGISRGHGVRQPARLPAEGRHTRRVQRDGQQRLSAQVPRLAARGRRRDAPCEGQRPGARRRGGAHAQWEGVAGSGSRTRTWTGTGTWAWWTGITRGCLTVCLSLCNTLAV